MFNILSPITNAITSAVQGVQHWLNTPETITLYAPGHEPGGPLDPHRQQASPAPSAFQQAITQPSTPPVQVTAPVQAMTTMQNNLNPSMSLEDMQKMIAVYGGPNSMLSQYAPDLLNATKMDFWKNNPELLALIPHLETNSGKYITRPNNIANWGINYVDPQTGVSNNDLFAQMDVGKVLNQFLTGVGQRSDFYTRFRTGAPLTNDQLLQFGKQYEPNNGDYGPNLVNGRNHIREVMGWSPIGQ